MNNIQIFAIDHRKTVNWDLPFIRVGTMTGDSCIHCGHTDDSLQQYKLPVSEIDSIWYICQHLSDFGNPDVIGFCHYRRFFSYKFKNACVNIADDKIDPTLIMTPLEQLAFMNSQRLDGILPCPLQEHFHQLKNIKTATIDEEIYQQTLDDNAGFTSHDCTLLVQNLLHFTPDPLTKAMQQAFATRTVHFGTIFTLNRRAFDIWNAIIWKTMFATISSFSRDRLLKLNCRAFGYFLERATSLILWAMKLEGSFSFQSMPLVVTNAFSKKSYQSQTTEQAGLACNIDGFKERFGYE